MKIDRKLPNAPDQSTKKRSKAPRGRQFVVVGRVKYPLHQDPRSRVWRIRKRTKDVKLDISLGSLSLEDAKKAAVEKLEPKHQDRERLRSGRATLREVCDVYERMPKRCSQPVARANVVRFARVVKDAWGRELEDVRCSELVTRNLWRDYAAKRQGGKLDLNTRHKENRGINSAMRLGLSIFHEGLEEGYEQAGIIMDFAAIRRIQWLPMSPVKLPKLAHERVEEMMQALPALKQENLPMWRAIMIARFAGLRSREISWARKSWLTKNSVGVWCFEVCDRPEEGWWHKTGEDYMPPILSQELVEDLLACPNDGPLVPVEGSRDYFFDIQCAEWIRQFIPPPNKTLHRLRALYAEALRDATANAILAQQAGTEAARKALGHTTSATTVKHYLPAS